MLRRIGIHNIGIIPIPFMASSLGGLIPVDFALGDITFTAAMDKRLSGGPFDRAPLVQGLWDGTGTPDVVSFPQGALLANQTDVWYANFDPYQGEAVKWWMPERDSGAGGTGYVWYISATYYLSYDYAAGQFTLGIGGQTMTRALAVSAGTTYLVTAGWDTKNTIDGTNYARIGTNDAFTYGIATQPTVAAASASCYVGSTGAASPANAIIEGLTIYRRVLYDGTYGTDVGNGDEINIIYAAGAGADPCAVTGAFGVVAAIPTDQADEALDTTGEAWSHPHGSNILDTSTGAENAFACDGFYGGGAYAVNLSAANMYINCGSDAGLDDLPGADFTAESWIRWDTQGSTNVVLRKSPTSLTRGWDISGRANNRLRARIYLDTTVANIEVASLPVPDGKWHHIALTWDFSLRTVYLWLDGEEIGSHTGVGNIVSDAADSLLIGYTSISLLGAVGWTRISDTLRYATGTDFIPVRAPPGIDGNTVAQWNMTEGTGVTVDNAEGTAARDGTLTNGPNWIETWEVEATPVIPQSVEFNGTTTNLDATSGANIDDLPGGANGFTAEGYFRADGAGESNNGTFWNKVSWYMRFDSATTIRVFIDYDTTDIDETFSWTPDGVKHHWMLTYNENGADRFARVYLDGVLFHTTAASVGNYVADAASTLYIGNNAAGSATFDGGIGWQALSDLVRASATFVPNSSELARANDANMHLRYAMTDGAGAAVADTSGNAYNGTLTNYIWNNTPDMATDEPGARAFEWGYNVGSDGASDGITIIQAVTAEQDYVNRLFISYGQSGRAWPEVYLYDNTGAAQISATYSLPRMTDVHTGANNSATLINANGSFTQQLVGWELYNITDGSSTTITAVSSDKTTITGVLAGGTDNDWDTNDVYIIRPPNGDSYCEHPIATENIFVFRTPVACVSADFKIRNAAGEGVMQVHQYEVYESLLNSGDMETGAGNPWIPDGWANGGLPFQAGELLQELAIVHSGSSALEIFDPAGVRLIVTSWAKSVGEFYAIGLWHNRAVQSAEAPFQDEDDTHVARQASATGDIALGLTISNWTHLTTVGRARTTTAATKRIVVTAGTYTVYVDDVYTFALDPITLTVTPASEANSAESSGIRIDGRDTAPSNIPVGRVGPSGGWFRWNWRPRHDAADLDSFGASNPTLIHVWGDANNHIQVYVSAANTITVTVTIAGVPNNANWNCAGLITADTEYLMELIYTGAGATLYQDSVSVVNVAVAINFPTTPVSIYWGHAQTSDGNVDAVYVAPS